MEICSDKRTVWINSDSGACIGRFSRFGIDIHRDFDAQQETGTECLHCTHSKPDKHDWTSFKEGMKKHYGINVPDEHMPEFLEAA